MNATFAMAYAAHGGMCWHLQVDGKDSLDEDACAICRVYIVDKQIRIPGLPGLELVRVPEGMCVREDGSVVDGDGKVWLGGERDGDEESDQA